MKLQNNNLLINTITSGEYTFYGLGWKNNQVVTISPKYILSSLLTELHHNKNENLLDFQLLPNYPNPFNTSTIIGYYLPTNCKVVIKIYDIQGKEITTLIDEYKNPGYYTIDFAPGNHKLSSGLYIYQLRANENIITKKMLLIK